MARKISMRFGLSTLIRYLVHSLVALILSACHLEKGGAPSSVCGEGVSRFIAIIASDYPHAGGEFTEGFLYRDGMIYESFGPKGDGGLIQYQLGSDEILRRHEIDAPDVFPEGLTWMGDSLVQLTEEHHRAYVYDPQSLSRTGTLSFEGTGWGLTSNSAELIRSDGSSTIFFHDPHTMEVLRTITVTELGQAVEKLNELEWIEGRIYANVWFKNEILIINPETGVVEATVDTSNVSDQEIRVRPHSVINGIAYRPESGRLLLTGKRWERIYEVDLVPNPRCEEAISDTPGDELRQ